MKNSSILAAALIAVGVALGGLFIALGINKMAVRDRAVTVKGLSTQDVKADHVVWPLSFGLLGNDLPSLNNDITKMHDTVRKFLISKGFSSDDIKKGNTSVSNNWANYYGERPEYHYTINTSVIVSTDNVDLVIANLGCQTELLSRGYIINSEEWALDYQYNGLNELKPMMIEEATKNARAVAQKFADDSNSKLGGIRRASQGQFSVEADQYQPWIKHVRVVTTVDYFLN
ncbi:MAG: SIMPL domain-containing protein [Paludibacteraceae bacterium]|nr:SIMPL domain-containing protein [Paludibacteraceae bacterium]